MLASTYPVRIICDVLDYARSSYYYRSASRDDEALRMAVQEIAGCWPTYGYRRVTVQLRREGWQVNKKQVQRLMRELGLQAEAPKRRVRTTNSEHGFARFPNLVQEVTASRPDQIWVADITYVRLQCEFVYLAVIMDVYTRSIRAWHLGRSLDQTLTLTALQRALAVGVPEIHHSDQGGQYAADAYVRRLQDAEVAISMAEVGEAWQNGYAERLIRTIKEEEVALSDYQDYLDAYRQIGHFISDVYNRKRIHSSLGYLTPFEFESAYQAELAEKEVFVQ
jgi:transposase InsO family protein